MTRSRVPTTTEKSVAAVPDATHILLRSAGKVYGSGPRATTALADVDLSVPRGRFVSVIGPSGCGKSTLLRLVAGLEEPDTGDVSIFGATARQASAAKSIGFVPQVPALLPWLSVLDNVRILDKVNRRAGRRRRRREAAGPAVAGCELAADPVQLLRRLGLGDALTQRPGQLSGGMQQRTAIARAFALQPDILLMDEPFSALDEFTREAVQLQLLDVWHETQTTVLFVTHSVTEAVLLSDTVVVMAARPGRIAAVVDIGLDRPRRHGHLDSDALHACEHAVRAELEQAWTDVLPENLL